MLTAGIVLFVLAVIAAAIIGILALSNMRNGLTGRGDATKAFLKHFDLMKFMIPAALSGVVGLVFILIGLVTR